MNHYSFKDLITFTLARHIKIPGIAIILIYGCLGLRKINKPQLGNPSSSLTAVTQARRGTDNCFKDTEGASLASSEMVKLNRAAVRVKFIVCSGGHLLCVWERRSQRSETRQATHDQQRKALIRQPC